MQYVPNGSKICTSLGSYAKYMILLARTNPDEKRYAGRTCCYPEYPSENPAGPSTLNGKKFLLLFSKRSAF